MKTPAKKPAKAKPMTFSRFRRGVAAAIEMFVKRDLPKSTSQRTRLVLARLCLTYKDTGYEGPEVAPLYSAYEEFTRLTKDEPEFLRGDALIVALEDVILEDLCHYQVPAAEARLLREGILGRCVA